MKTVKGFLPAIVIIAAVIGGVVSFVWRGPNWPVIAFTSVCLGVLIIIAGRIWQQRSASGRSEGE